MMNRLIFLPLIAAAMHASVYASEIEKQLMPIPHSIVEGDGTFRIDRSFAVSVQGEARERVYAAASRMVRRLDNRTGLFIHQEFVTPATDPQSSNVIIEVGRAGVVKLGEDESYRLVVDDHSVRLSAPTGIGALRGMETLLQLVSSDEAGYYIPAVTIEDAPRFPR